MAKSEKEQFHKIERKKNDRDDVYFANLPINEHDDVLFVPDKFPKKRPKRAQEKAQEKMPKLSSEEEERLRSVIQKHGESLIKTSNPNIPMFQDRHETKERAMSDTELQQLIRYFVEIQKEYGTILAEQEELIKNYRDLISKQTNLLAEVMETIGKGQL
jgi:hypothetical protein